MLIARLIRLSGGAKFKCARDSVTQFILAVPIVRYIALATINLVQTNTQALIYRVVSGEVCKKCA